MLSGFSLLPGYRGPRVDVEASAAEPVVTPANVNAADFVGPMGFYGADKYGLADGKEDEKGIAHPQVHNSGRLSNNCLGMVLWIQFVLTFIFVCGAALIIIDVTHGRSSVTSNCVSNYCTLGDKISFGVRDSFVASPDNTTILINLEEQYRNRTAEHTRFTDINTIALLKQLVNISTTIADKLSPGTLSVTFENATTNIEKMEVMYSMVKQLADLAGDHLNLLHEDALVEQFDSATARSVAINNELDEYEAFLAMVDQKVFEIAGGLPAVKKLYPSPPHSKRENIAASTKTTIKLLESRSLKLNGTSTNTAAALIPGAPEIADLSFPLIMAAFNRRAPSINIPFELFNSSTPNSSEMLVGTYNSTLGINLYPTFANKLFACKVKFSVFALPSHSVFGAGNSDCQTYTYAEATSAGLGINDKQWMWYDGEYDALSGSLIVGGSGEQGDWRFEFGERDVGELVWVVEKGGRVELPAPELRWAISA